VKRFAREIPVGVKTNDFAFYEDGDKEIASRDKDRVTYYGKSSFTEHTHLDEHGRKYRVWLYLGCYKERMEQILWWVLTIIEFCPYKENSVLNGEEREAVAQISIMVIILLLSGVPLAQGLTTSCSLLTPTGLQDRRLQLMASEILSASLTRLQF